MSPKKTRTRSDVEKLSPMFHRVVCACDCVCRTEGLARRPVPSRRSLLPWLPDQAFLTSRRLKHRLLINALRVAQEVTRRPEGILGLLLLGLCSPEFPESFHCPEPLQDAGTPRNCVTKSPWAWAQVHPQVGAGLRGQLAAQMNRGLRAAWAAAPHPAACDLDLPRADDPGREDLSLLLRWFSQ